LVYKNIVAKDYVIWIIKNLLSFHGKTGYRLGARKGLPELISILDKALDAIPEEDRLAMAQKWVPIATPKVAPLTLGEQAWQAEHPVVRLGSLDDWPPFEFVGDDNAFAGVIADVVGRIRYPISL
jgi:two-component system sensor histidine kinase EvgS